MPVVVVLVSRSSTVHVSLTQLFSLRTEEAVYTVKVKETGCKRKHRKLWVAEPTIQSARVLSWRSICQSTQFRKNTHVTLSLQVH